MKRRQHKPKNNHYCLLVNQKSANYNPVHIKKLTGAIRKNGDYYTVFEPDSPVKLLHTAQKVAGLRRWHRQIPQVFQKRGKVTALIACGGDGTVNLLGRVGIRSKLPIGILPMGRFNNIAKSLLQDCSIDSAIKTILKGQYNKIDHGSIGRHQFFGSLGFGFVVNMQKLLTQNGIPRFGFRWNQYSGKAISESEETPIVIKIDAFRFEVSPHVLNINLLPYSIGLPFSNVSMMDDAVAEIVFDFNTDKKKIAQFIRQLYKKKYIYGTDIKLFRGKKINIQPVIGKLMYLDGELIEIPKETVDIEIIGGKLKILS